MQKILEIQNCRESFRKWVKHFKGNSDTIEQTIEESSSLSLAQSKGQKTNADEEKQVDQSLNKYLRTVKPVIDSFSSLTQALSEKEYGFYSTALSKNQIDYMKQLFEPLRKFYILSKEEFTQNIEKINEQEVQTLIKKSEPIYKMNLQSPPENAEYKYWGHTIPVEKFTITGDITKGKGLGKEGLGMPTANIQIPQELNKTLEQYPNGIYITTITFKNKPSQIYIGASSLGTNPHYENSTSSRILETYIVNDFKDETFYGETIQTEFHQLIRPEFKFKDFSAFLNGMRNDIQVAKQWGKKIKSEKQLFCS